MHHPTDRIAHTTAFVTPVVEHWLEREIAQWVHPMKDRSDDPSHHERTLLPRSYISLWNASFESIELTRQCVVSEYRIIIADECSVRIPNHRRRVVRARWTLVGTSRHMIELACLYSKYLTSMRPSLRSPFTVDHDRARVIHRHLIVVPISVASALCEYIM